MGQPVTTVFYYFVTRLVENLHTAAADHFAASAWYATVRGIRRASSQSGGCRGGDDSSDDDLFHGSLLEIKLDAVRQGGSYCATDAECISRPSLL